MYKHINIILATCFLVLACDISHKPKKPDHLISKDQMVSLMYDLYIINAAKGINEKLLEQNGFVPETYIFTKYDIDSTQFAESNTYYAFDPETYKSMIDKVKARLEKDKKIYEDLQNKEGMEAKRKRDSIKMKAKNKKPEVLIKADSIKNSVKD